ncbi:MAG TPA: glycosyl hydrolase, partial [Verrucomicrobiae bacterium]
APAMKFIHRRAGDTEIYFVSNQQKTGRTVDCTFRIGGKVPELWHADSGRTETLALYREANGATTIPIQFDPAGSVFVIFRTSAASDHAVAISSDGKELPAAGRSAAIEIQKATYGASDDPAKSRDVTSEVQQLVAAGRDTLPVADFNKNGDPAYGVIKTLTVNYRVDGQARTVSASEGGEVSFAQPSMAGADIHKLWRSQDGGLYLQSGVCASYEIKMASGKTVSVQAPALPAALTLDGPWRLTFLPKLGAPATVDFDHLMSWTESTDAGVKYFSGTATYEKDVEIPAEYLESRRQLLLDLGAVKNIAEVSLNGKPLGVLWKAPFSVDITDAAQAGKNKLEIRITNLWPNRMIGDQKLPEAQRITWASVQPYRADSPLLPSGLLGPVRIVPSEILTVAQP